jgi:maleate cis-trans isomerase
MDQLERLERELGLPVVSSNAATLWLGLHRMGLPRAHLPIGRLCRLEPRWTACSRDD